MFYFLKLVKISPVLAFDWNTEYTVYVYNYAIKGTFHSVIVLLFHVYQCQRLSMESIKGNLRTYLLTTFLCSVCSQFSTVAVFFIVPTSKLLQVISWSDMSQIVGNNQWFLANVNWTSRSLYVVVRPSDVCRLSVTFVRPTQAIEIFGNISTPFGTLAICWHPGKISRWSSRGTPPFGELNTRLVAEYSDFGPIERYISETVQDSS